MKLASTISLALLCSIGLMHLANAGPEKIKFPEGFDKGVRYAIVDRHDSK